MSQVYNTVIQLYVCVCVCVHVCAQLLSHVLLFTVPLLCPWDSPGKNTGVGCHALLQEFFPTQGSVSWVCGTGRGILYHYAT